MSQQDPTASMNHSLDSGRSSARRSLLLLGLVVVAFLVFLGLRVRGAVDNRKGMAEEQSAAVATAKAAAARPPSVEVVRGSAVAWEAAVPFEGTLSARQEADLGFKVPGRLARISAKVGDVIRAGQTLATLSTDEASAQLVAAQAQLAAAQAQAGLAADAEKRTALVVQTGAQSEAAGVQAQKQKQLAEAQANAAAAQAQLARTSLSNHKLTAPFSGTVTRAPNAPGAVVAPGVPLFHLAELGTLKLMGTVGADDAALVKTGAAIEVLGDDGKSVVGRGKITAVVPALDPSTKRVPVEATVANDGREPLLAGSLVRATVRGSKPVTVLSYPHTILRPGSQNEVLVVSEGKLSVRRVEHTVAADGSLLVRKGLRPDDAVVLRPWPEAAEGLTVTVAAAAPAPAGREAQR
jgi:RND family efflux transporter MFP subunit